MASQTKATKLLGVLRPYVQPHVHAFSRTIEILSRDSHMASGPGDPQKIPAATKVAGTRCYLL
jgi:hypothetical protein